MVRRKPSFENVVKIARALGVSVAAFAEENGDAAPSRPAKRKRGK